MVLLEVDGFGFFFFVSWLLIFVGLVQSEVLGKLAL